jgi:hypothetical protein
MFSPEAHSYLAFLIAFSLFFLPSARISLKDLIFVKSITVEPVYFNTRMYSSAELLPCVVFDE